MRGGWILKVDIQHYFDTLDHQHRRRFLDQRVRDGVIRRIIDKWLNAGVLERTSRTHSHKLLNLLHISLIGHIGLKTTKIESRASKGVRNVRWNTDA